MLSEYKGKGKYSGMFYGGGGIFMGAQRGGDWIVIVNGGEGWEVRRQGVLSGSKS